MTGEEHYLEGERLLADASRPRMYASTGDYEASQQSVARLVDRAHAHFAAAVAYGHVHGYQISPAREA